MILSPINTICRSSDWKTCSIYNPLSSWVWSVWCFPTLMGQSQGCLKHLITSAAWTWRGQEEEEGDPERGSIRHYVCVCVFTRGVPSPDYTAWHPQKPKDSRSCKLNGGTWPSWRLLYLPYSPIKCVSPSVYAVRKVCQHFKYF